MNLTPTSAGAAFTLTAGSSTIGDYNFDVQGAGSDPNSTTHLTNLNLHIVNFGLTTPSPSTVSVPPGATSPPVSFQVTAQGSFNQSVTVSCSLSPSIFGATCAFTPGTVVDPTSAAPVNMSATVTVPAGTTAGNYSVTLQATTMGASPLTTSFTLTVTAIQDFTINSSTASQSVTAGQTTGPYNLTIAPVGALFSGAVTVSCSGIPAGAQCNFTPNPVTPGSNPVSVVMTIATGGATNANTYNVVVTGTSGSLSHSTTVSLIVLDSLQLAVSQPFPAAVDAGSQTSAKVSVTSNYNGAVNATCDASALSGQCAVTPGNPLQISTGIPVMLTLTVNIPNGTAPKSYNINLTVAAASGQPSQTLTLPLVIQDFALSTLTPASQTIAAGQSASYNFTVSPLGAAFANAVALTCSGIPSGAQCNFTPNPVTPGNASTAVVMTISTSTTTGSGTYTVTVLGTSGPLSHSSTASLTVAQGSFQLAITQPFPAGADAGSQQSAKVSLTPNYAGSVKASCDASAFSGQCSVTPVNPVLIVAGTVVTLTLTVNIPSSAAPQPSNPYNLNLTVTDSSGQASQTLPIPLTVIQDFTVGTLTPSTQTITPGQSASYNFSVLPVGASFANATTLSCSGGPTISLCKFTPNPVTPGSSSAAVVLKITTTASSANLVSPGSGHAALFYALWLTLPGLALLRTQSHGRKRANLALPASLIGLFLLALLLTSCGGGTGNGGGGGGGQQQGTQPGTYSITVTGASGALVHQASAITLVVNP